jgi:hypothetical protein
MREGDELDPRERHEEMLDPHRREERARVAVEIVERLRERGVSVTGRETDEELVELLEAVEAFERQVEARGGDLMVDEGPRGVTREPDDRHFVVPQRRPGESAASYLARLREATSSVRQHPPREA